jgi:hypothetical protein
MLAAEVNSVQVRDGTDFTRNGGVANYQLFTFFIGDHGPFSEKFYAAEQNTPAIERRINDRVASLRALGVIPGPQQST